MRELAKYTQPIIEAFSKLAVSYNVNIIAGSMPNLKEIRYIMYPTCSGAMAAWRKP
jgi:glutaredoxin-related protein